MAQLSPRLGAEWNRRGALFMVLSMVGFTIEDLCAKLAAQTLPFGQVLLSIGLTGVVFFALMARRASERLLPPAFTSRVMLIRSGFEIIGRFFYILAFTLTPLSTASAILQATPLVVVAGAALIFRETVSLARWLAVAVGLAGVLMILRPGGEGFGILSLLAVLAMLGFAGRDLATRAAPASLSNNQLGILGFSVLSLAGIVALPFAAAPHLPDPAAALWLALSAAGGIAGYGTLTIAMRTGEVGAVTPFRYSRLLFALLAAVIVFHERPDFWTLAGSAVIVLAGLMALRRRR